MDLLSRIYLYGLGDEKTALEIEYERAYQTAKSYWDDEKFGTSPVKDAYWCVAESTPSGCVITPMQSIRDAQYKFNKIKSDVLEAEYGNSYKMYMRSSMPMGPGAIVTVASLPPPIAQYYDRKLLQNSGQTMVFRRYPHLDCPEPMNLFLRCFLKKI